jgi:hypothetical protein
MTMATTRLDLTREGRAARTEWVVQLTRLGHSTVDIAHIVGISARSVTRNRRLAGLTANYVRPRVPSEDELLCAKRMLVDGCSYPEVSRSLGFSPTTWMKHHPGYSWTSSEAGRHGKAIQQLGRRAGVAR